MNAQTTPIGILATEILSRAIEDAKALNVTGVDWALEVAGNVSRRMVALDIDLNSPLGQAVTAKTSWAIRPILNH